MKRLLFFCFIVLLSISSCQKEKQETAPETLGTIINPEEYYPYNYNNYWIYSLYEIKPNGEAIDLNKKDTVITGYIGSVDDKPYISLLILGDMPGFYHYHIDSSGYLLTPGKPGFAPIIFAANDKRNPLYQYTQIWGDTAFVYTNRMLQSTKKISVPAGTFEVLTLEENYDIKRPAPESYRTYHRHWARNVGLVSFQFGAINRRPIKYEDTRKFEYRLAEFHIVK